MSNVIYKEDDDDYCLADDRNIPIQLGKACVNAEFFGLFDNASTYDEDSFLLDAVERVEEEILDKLHSETLSKALRSLDILLIDPLIGGIKNMIEYNRYEDLAIISNTLQERNTRNPISLMILSFLKIITREADWDIPQGEILWNKIESVKMPDDNIENLMSYYSMYGIVSAYFLEKYLPISKIQKSEDRELHIPRFYGSFSCDEEILRKYAPFQRILDDRFLDGGEFDLKDDRLYYIYENIPYITPYSFTFEEIR